MDIPYKAPTTPVPAGETNLVQAGLVICRSAAGWGCEVPRYTRCNMEELQIAPTTGYLPAAHLPRSLPGRASVELQFRFASRRPWLPCKQSKTNVVSVVASSVVGKRQASMIFLALWDGFDRFYSDRLQPASQPPPPELALASGHCVSSCAFPTKPNLHSRPARLSCLPQRPGLLRLHVADLHTCTHSGARVSTSRNALAKHGHQQPARHPRAPPLPR